MVAVGGYRKIKTSNTQVKMLGRQEISRKWLVCAADEDDRVSRRLVGCGARQMVTDDWLRSKSICCVDQNAIPMSCQQRNREGTKRAG
jgi:hypothetical protein